ncbi:MAG: ATP-binding cassette domain-containing protein [Alphaproteobacteria bacterium]
MSASAPFAVEAKHITNRFGSQLVHDRLDFSVRQGEIVGIVGGSGAGKTVLLRTLLGLNAPVSGEVRIFGKPIAALAPREKAASIGVLFQQGALFSSMSVAQNVMMPLAEYTDLTEEERREIAAMKIELAGLSSEAGLKMPAQLSGGMVKRASLARALALDPRILFLDEPTSDLDTLTAASIDALIRKLNASLGVTVVIVTHDPNTLVSTCDRIAVLSDHKIIMGTLDELLDSKDEWTHDFFHNPRAQGAILAGRAQQPQEAPHGNR